MLKLRNACRRLVILRRVYMLTRQEIETYMKEGEQAFHAKKTAKDIPYSKYTEKGRLWLRGFVNSAYGSKFAPLTYSSTVDNGTG